jgi:hypothetical protein
MRLLIFLMAASSLGCRALPEKPNFNLYQPVITVICEQNKQCSEQSFCNVYENINGEWRFKEELPINKCSGILGVTSSDFVKIKDYMRRLDSYIKNGCGNVPSN